MSISSSSEKLRARCGYVPGPGEGTLELRELVAQHNLEVYLKRLNVIAVDPVPTALEGLALLELETTAGRLLGLAVPSSFDWRNVAGKNFITAVKNQGNCGTCVPFSVIAAVEAIFRITKNDPHMAIDLSEAHLFFCHGRRRGKLCDTGWDVAGALEPFKEDGVVDETCYPGFYPVSTDS
jgi:hypothetical protein